MVALNGSPAEASPLAGAAVCGQDHYRYVYRVEIALDNGSDLGWLRLMDVHIKRVGDDGWWQSDPTNGFSYAGPVYRERNGGTIVAVGRISKQWVKLWWNPKRHCIL